MQDSRGLDRSQDNVEKLSKLKKAPLENFRDSSVIKTLIIDSHFKITTLLDVDSINNLEEFLKVLQRLLNQSSNLEEFSLCFIKLCNEYPEYIDVIDFDNLYLDLDSAEKINKQLAVIIQLAGLTSVLLSPDFMGFAVGSVFGGLLLKHLNRRTSDTQVVCELIKQECKSSRLPYYQQLHIYKYLRQHELVEEINFCEALRVLSNHNLLDLLHPTKNRSIYYRSVNNLESFDLFSVIGACYYEGVFLKEQESQLVDFLSKDFEIASFDLGNKFHRLLLSVIFINRPSYIEFYLQNRNLSLLEQLFDFEQIKAISFNEKLRLFFIDSDKFIKLFNSKRFKESELKLLHILKSYLDSGISKAELFTNEDLLSKVSDNQKLLLSTFYEYENLDAEYIDTDLVLDKNLLQNVFVNRIIKLGNFRFLKLHDDAAFKYFFYEYVLKQNIPLSVFTYSLSINEINYIDYIKSLDFNSIKDAVLHNGEVNENLKQLVLIRSEDFGVEIVRKVKEDLSLHEWSQFKDLSSENQSFIKAKINLIKSTPIDFSLENKIILEELIDSLKVYTSDDLAQILCKKRFEYLEPDMTHKLLQLEVIHMLSDIGLCNCLDLNNFEDWYLLFNTNYNLLNVVGSLLNTHCILKDKQNEFFEKLRSKISLEEFDFDNTLQRNVLSFMLSRDLQLFEEYLINKSYPCVKDLVNFDCLNHLDVNEKLRLFFIDPNKFCKSIKSDRYYDFETDSTIKLFLILKKYLDTGISQDKVFIDQNLLTELNDLQKIYLGTFYDYDSLALNTLPDSVVLDIEMLKKPYIAKLIKFNKFYSLNFKDEQTLKYFFNEYILNGYASLEVLKVSCALQNVNFINFVRSLDINSLKRAILADGFVKQEFRELLLIRIHEFEPEMINAFMKNLSFYELISLDLLPTKFTHYLHEELEDLRSFKSLEGSANAHIQLCRELISDKDFNSLSEMISTSNQLEIELSLKNKVAQLHAFNLIYENDLVDLVDLNQIKSLDIEKDLDLSDLYSVVNTFIKKGLIFNHHYDELLQRLIAKTDLKSLDFTNEYHRDLILTFSRTNYKSFLLHLSHPDLLDFDPFFKVVPYNFKWDSESLATDFARKFILENNPSSLQFEDTQTRNYFFKEYVLTCNVSLLDFLETLSAQGLDCDEYIKSLDLELIKSYIFNDEMIDSDLRHLILIRSNDFDSDIVHQVKNEMSLELLIDLNNVSACCSHFLIEKIENSGINDLEQSSLNKLSYFITSLEVDSILRIIDSLDFDSQYYLARSFTGSLSYTINDLLDVSEREFFRSLFKNAKIKFSEANPNLIDISLLEQKPENFEKLRELIYYTPYRLKITDAYAGFILNRFFQAINFDNSSLIADQDVHKDFLKDYLNINLSDLKKSKPKFLDNINILLKVLINNFPDQIDEFLVGSQFTSFISDYSTLNFNSDFDKDLQEAKVRFSNVNFQLFLILLARRYEFPIKQFSGNDFSEMTLEQVLDFYEGVSIELNSESKLDFNNLKAYFNDCTYKEFELFVLSLSNNQPALKKVLEALFTFSSNDVLSSNTLVLFTDLIVGFEIFKGFDLFFKNPKLDLNILNSLDINYLFRVFVNLSEETIEDIILHSLDQNVQSKLFDLFVQSRTALEKINIRDKNLMLYLESEFYMRYNNSYGIVINTHVFDEQDYFFLCTCFRYKRIKFKIDLKFAKYLIRNLFINKSSISELSLDNALSSDDLDLSGFFEENQNEDIDLSSFFEDEVETITKETGVSLDDFDEYVDLSEFYHEFKDGIDDSDYLAPLKWLAKMSGGDCINLLVEICRTQNKNLITEFINEIDNSFEIDPKKYSRLRSIGGDIGKDFDLLIKKLGYVDKYMSIYVLKSHLDLPEVNYGEDHINNLFNSIEDLSDIITSYSKVDTYNIDPSKGIVFESDLERYLFLLSYAVFTSEWGKLTFNQALYNLKLFEKIDREKTRVSDYFTPETIKVDSIKESVDFRVNTDTLLYIEYLQKLLHEFDLSEWDSLSVVFDSDKFDSTARNYKYIKYLADKSKFNPDLDFDLINNLDLVEILESELNDIGVSHTGEELNTLLKLKKKTLQKRYPERVVDIVNFVKNLQMNILSDYLQVNIGVDRNLLKSQYSNYYNLSWSEISELDSLIHLPYKDVLKTISDKKLLGHLNAFKTIEFGTVFDLLSISTDIPAFVELKGQVTLNLIKFCVASGIHLDEFSNVDIFSLQEKQWLELKEVVNYAVNDKLTHIFSDSKIFSTIKKLLAYDTLSEVQLSKKISGGELDFDLHPLRDVSMEFSGQLVDACWAGKYHRGVAEEMSNITFYRFGYLDKTDESDIYTILGGTMIVEGYDTDGKKLLIIRGFNPTVDCLQRFFPESVLFKFISSMLKVASKQDARVCLIVDQSHGASTNRDQIFKLYDDIKPYLNKVEVDLKAESIVFNRYDLTHRTMFEVTQDMLDEYLKSQED